MKVNIKYFAAMREKAGVSEELIETNAKTAADLLTEMTEKHGFTLDAKNLKVAVNEEYTPFSTVLNENDTIVFIPPVAGG